MRWAGAVAVAFWAVQPAAVLAQAGTGWQYDAGARTAWTCDGGNCVGLSCEAGKPRVMIRANGSAPSGAVRMLVDQGRMHHLRFAATGDSATAEVPPGGLIAEMMAGTTLHVENVGAFGLNGSAAAIRGVSDACAPVRRGALRPLTEQQRLRNPGPGGTMMHGCSTDAAGKPVDCTVFDRYADTDIPGFDLRSGLTDPLLRDMSREECETLCVATHGCGAYVYNHPGGKVCFLKSHDGAAARFRGATAGVMRGKPLAPPPLDGYPAAGVPGVDNDAAPRRAETATQAVTRMRGVARRWGGDCSAEWAEMDRVARSLRLQAAGASAVVGQNYDIGWSLDAPDLRIPLWLSVATPAPVRMSGGFTLGPQAVNPFAMQAGAGQTRTMVALWQRDAPTDGTVAITPLVAGRMQVAVRLVGWVRACEREIVLGEQAVSVDVSPAPAQVVMSTPTGNAAFTHAVHLPAMGRRVEFNETRYRIVTNDGTELVQRVGTGLAVSPTQRFLTADQDSAQEIIDVMDGALVGRSVSQLSYWIDGDTFLISTYSPWGSATVHSPFSASTLVEELKTGPACCPIAPAEVETLPGGENWKNSNIATHLSVDLQNHLLAVQGDFGWSVRSLNEDAKDYGTNPGSAYNSYGEANLAMTGETLRNIGAVTPVAVKPDFQIAGGVSIQSATYAKGVEARDRAVERMQKAGLNVEVLNRQPEPVVLAAADGIFRGAATAVGSGALFHLDRIGVRMAEGVAGVDMVFDADGKPNARPLENYEDADAFKARHKAMFDQVLADARKVGWPFFWADHDQSNDTSGSPRECYHFPEGIGEVQMDEASFPVDVQQVLRHETPTGPVYLARAFCQAGATLGSLRHASALGVFDMTGAPTASKKASVSGDYRLSNTYAAKIWDDPLTSRLYGRILLLFSPGNGGAAVWDLDRHRFVWQGDTLPGGDLMQDVWLTEDRGHVVQFNADGAFFVYRLADDRQVLSGRIVDDEIAVWTADYQYDATAEAAQRIDLKFPGLDRQYSLDRFGAARHVPGLAAQVLAGAALAEVAPVSVPPDLTGEIALDGTAVRVAVQAGRGAAALRVYQDGVLTATRDVAPDETAITETHDRLPGVRHFAVVAVDAQGLVSLPVRADLGPDPRAAQPQRRAMMVGIDLYEDAGLGDLNYAKADADRMRRALTAEGGAGFDLVTLLPDRKATPEAILDKAAQMVDGLAEGDQAVIFLAGHGLRGDDGGLYLATTETRLDDLGATALAWRDLAAVLTRTKARVTVMIDACHSGAAGFATNDEVAADLSAQPTNITILSASKGRQQSAESAEYGGGLFTLALEWIIGGGRATFDADGNGQLEADEVDAAVTRLVNDASGGEQTPWMTRSRMVGRYGLF